MVAKFESFRRYDSVYFRTICYPSFSPSKVHTASDAPSSSSPISSWIVGFLNPWWYTHLACCILPTLRTIHQEPVLSFLLLLCSAAYGKPRGTILVPGHRQHQVEQSGMEFLMQGGQKMEAAYLCGASTGQPMEHHVYVFGSWSSFARQQHGRWAHKGLERTAEVSGERGGRVSTLSLSQFGSQSYALHASASHTFNVFRALEKL